MSKKLNTLSDAWYDAYALMKKYPRILFPLFIVSFFEGLLLEFLYFAPRAPLNKILLPPIKRYGGEVAVHYPAFLFAIPKFFEMGQLVLYVAIGGILTAVAIVLGASAQEERLLTFGGAWKKVQPRLFSLILVAGFIVALLRIVIDRETALLKWAFQFAGRGALFQWLRVIAALVPLLNFFVAIVLQVFVVFILPFLILDNKKLFPAIGRSFALGWKHFWRVFVLILVPMVCYGPIWFFKANLPLLVILTRSPESILWLFGLGIPATLLVDTFVAVASALFFLRLKNEKSG